MTEPSAPRGWRSQPLFISSTFRDMQAERDHLHDEVFPALEEWLRGYRMLLEPLDLRWGVETSDEGEAERKEKLVLKVCLDGIAECRPYLIVLLGDRYGWVPPPVRLAETAVEYGFTPETVVGMSVTALEIEAGLLAEEEQAPRSLVYLRQPLPYEQMPQELRPVYSDAEAGNTDAAERLDSLKDGLRNHPQLGERVRDYNLDWDAEHQRPTTESLRAWGEQVLADLKATLAPDVEAHAANNSSELTWRDEEAFELEAFVEHRARTFVGREPTIREAEALAFGPDEERGPWAALYTGAAGAGKSALLAELFRRWRQRDDAVVLAHAAGISPRSAWVTPMLRRWIAKLSAIQGVEEPVSDDDDHESVAAAFQDLVTNVAQHRRVVLLLDALNQFEERAWRDQSWVPAGRPNIRLIATAIPGPAGDRLHEAHHGVEARELPLLSADEAGAIAAAACARYRKTLADPVLAALKQHPSAANALWLRMAIDELLLLDAEDFEEAEYKYADRPPDERLVVHMVHLLTEVFPTDVPGMYGHLLERLEERFGADTVRAFALAIGLSRSGWPEQSLKALVPRLGGIWDDTIGASLRRAFRLHLIRNGNPPTWDFFHPLARQAVHERYPSSADERRVQHNTIAAHLAELPNDDPIAARELMHHLIEAENILTAAVFYEHVDEAHPAREPASDSIAARVIEGAKVDDDNPGLVFVRRLLDKAAEAPMDWLRLPENLMFRVIYRVRGQVPEETARALAALLQNWHADNRPTHASSRYIRDLATSHAKLGKLESTAGNPAAAREHLGQAHAFFEDLHTRIASNDTARNLALSHTELGNLEDSAGNPAAAREHHEQALALREDLHARIADAYTTSDLATSHTNLGDLERSTGNPAAAREHYEQALALREDFHARIASAETTSDLAVSHTKLGELEDSAGNSAAAREHYEQALALCEDLHARSASGAKDLSTSHHRLGELERAAGNAAAAREHHEQALALRKGLHARIASANTAVDLAASHDLLGDLERWAGNPAAAREHHEQTLALREDLHARIASPETARNLAVSHDRLGDLEHMAGNAAAARAYFEQAHASFEDLHARIANAVTAHNLAASHNRLGVLEHMAGNAEAARAYFKQALALREDLHAHIANANTASSLATSHTKLGELERAAGNAAAAREHHEQALALREDLHARIASSYTTSDLAMSHTNLGDLEDSAGNSAAAREHYEQALALREDLHARIADAETASILCASLSRLAHLCSEQKDGQAAHHFVQRIYDTLSQMIREGHELDAPTLNLYEQIRHYQFGNTTRTEPSEVDSSAASNEVANPWYAEIAASWSQKSSATVFEN